MWGKEVWESSINPRKFICVVGHALFAFFVCNPTPIYGGEFSYVINNGEITITQYHGLGGDVVVPNFIEDLPVTVIGNDSFSPSNVETVSLGGNIRDIEFHAFAFSSKLESVHLGPNVTNISSFAFAHCQKLGKVVVPDSVISFGDFAFEKCFRLTNITLSAGLRVLGESPFLDCPGIPALTIPDGMHEIGEKAFYRCGLTNVVIHEGVTNIAAWAFANSGLKTIKFPVNFEEVGADTFRGSALEWVEFPSGLTNIGDRAFGGCGKLRRVKFPDSLLVIGDEAFSGGGSLEHVSFPGGIQRIGDRSFYQSGMLGAYFEGGPPETVGSEVFFSTDDAFNPSPLLTFVYHHATEETWGINFAGCPTRVWDPRFPAGDAIIGVSDGSFQFRIVMARIGQIRTAGQPTYVAVGIEATERLTEPEWNWFDTAIFDFDASFSGVLIDPGWGNNPRRFYRLVMP